MTNKPQTPDLTITQNGKAEGYWVGYFEDGSVITSITGTFKDGVKISD